MFNEIEKNKCRMLNLMASYAYDEYIGFREEGLVVAEYLYSNGFIYIKDNGDSYDIRLSFIPEAALALSDIEVYLQETKKHYILMNGKNIKVYEFFVKRGYSVMYSAFQMRLDQIQSHTKPSELRPYREEDFEAFIRVLGAFEPMRKELQLEPYNWYKENQDEAKIKFGRHAKENNIFSYSINGYIVGVGILDKNEIDTIAVDINYQKQGIGRQLLDTMIQIVRLRGYQSTFLSVMAINQKAINLYESLGFKTECVMTVMED